MKTFKIDMLLTREQNDSELENIESIESEITSWLEDLDFKFESLNVKEVQTTEN
jgi:hypothetical protein